MKNIRIEQPGNIRSFDRSITNAAMMGVDLYQHFKPEQAARTVADKANIKISGRGLTLDCFGNAVGTNGECCGIARHENGHAHRRTSARMSPRQCSSTLA
ncbi:hypothetical protein D3C87_1135260 [compost metagenome]